MRKPVKSRSYEMDETPRKVAIWLVLTCAALVFVNLVAWLLFRSDALAKRAMEAMARDYYENYWYDKWDQDKLGEYAEKGLPTVNLRVLLSYDSGKNAEQEAYFTKTACNATETTVRFYPEEPYGRHDYRMEINYSCNFE